MILSLLSIKLSYLYPPPPGVRSWSLAPWCPGRSLGGGASWTLSPPPGCSWWSPRGTTINKAVLSLTHNFQNTSRQVLYLINRHYHFIEQGSKIEGKKILILKILQIYSESSNRLEISEYMKTIFFPPRAWLFI